MLLVEAHGEVVGNLSAGRDDDAMRVLKLEDIHNTFEGKLVEVEAVAHVVVRRYRLRIVVDHHRAPALLANRVQRLHTAPVELHRASDAIGTRAEDDDRAVVAQVGNVVFRSAVSQVEVVRLGRIFRGERIYLLDDRRDAPVFSVLANLQQSAFGVFHLFLENGTGDLEVGETLHLGATHQFVGNLLNLRAGFQLVSRVDDIVELLEEPAVDFRQFVNLVDGVARAESLRDDEDAAVGRLAQGLVDVGDNQFFVLHESVHPLPNHTQALLDSFLEGAADSHDLAHRLHA